MTLTPEQQTQCRADFEEWIADQKLTQEEELVYRKLMQFVWQAAWRPRLTAHEIREIIRDAIMAGDDPPTTLYRAMGGEKDE